MAVVKALHIYCQSLNSLIYDAACDHRLSIDSAVWILYIIFVLSSPLNLKSIFYSFITFLYLIYIKPWPVGNYADTTKEQWGNNMTGSVVSAGQTILKIGQS